MRPDTPGGKLKLAPVLRRSTSPFSSNRPMLPRAYTLALPRNRGASKPPSTAKYVHNPQRNLEKLSISPARICTARQQGPVVCAPVIAIHVPFKNFRLPPPPS